MSVDTHLVCDICGKEVEEAQYHRYVVRQETHKIMNLEFCEECLAKGSIWLDQNYKREPNKEQFIELWNEGTDVEEIADTLGIEPTSVYYKAYQLRKRGEPVKTRSRGRKPKGRNNSRQLVTVS